MAVAQVRTAKTPKMPPLGAPEPSKTAEEVPFWPWIAAFTADDWGYKIIVYLWLVSPMIDRKANGKATSVGTYSRPFTIETILREHGSGHYRFDVCEIQATGNKQERIRQHYEVLLDMSYPPRVPIGEWLNYPENEMWKWAEEPLRLQQAQSQARLKAIEDGHGPGTMADPSQIFTTILEGVKTLRPEGGDQNGGLAATLLAMVMKNQEAQAALNDPTKQLTTLKALMNELSPKQQGSDAATLMLEFMKDQVTALREELKEMRLATNKQSFTEQLREFTAVFTEVAPSLGFNKRGTPNPNPNPSGGTDWGNVIEKVLDKGQAFVPVIVAAMNRPAIGAAPPGPQWTPTLPAQPVQQAVQTNPQPNPQPQEQQPDMSNLSPEEQTAVKQVEARAQACWAKHQGLITQVAPFLVDRFKAKETGYDLRDWFLDRYGSLQWGQFKEDSGPEVITFLVGLHPALRIVLTPPALVMQYFVEFFTLPGEEPDGAIVDEAETDDEPEPDNAA
jgi:hypothetical protein